MRALPQRRSRAPRCAAWLLLALASLPAWGCQSLRSWNHSCPGVYSGVRFFSDQVGDLPWDGKVFFVFDLPLTLVFDTLSLPVTAFAEQRRPTEGWVIGCRWAARR